MQALGKNTGITQPEQEPKYYNKCHHRKVHLASLIPNSSNAKPADLDTRGYSQAIREQSVLADAIGFNFARDSWDNSTKVGENTLYEGSFTLREEDPSTRKNLEGRATFR